MKANFKKYISIAVVFCLLMALASLAACKDKNKEDPTQPEQTSSNTTPIQEEETTTPQETGTTVAFPSDEEVDPKQEDVFFE